MAKKLLIFIIILAILIILLFVYNYFSGGVAKAPDNSSKEFRGPIIAPNIKGPSSPPPTE